MKILPAILLIALTSTAAAEDISSEYTDLDTDKHCSAYGRAAEGEGEWANLVCSGWRGYPVIMQYGDLRESMFYGFPPEGELAWQSFSAFNSTGPKIEWRIVTYEGNAVPFATIHRWFVSDPEDAEKKTEVLVVSKVAHMDSRESCAVGLVVASGKPNANEMARRIADEQVRDFVCGADERVVVGEPMPEFTRSEN